MSIHEERRSEAFPSVIAVCGLESKSESSKMKVRVAESIHTSIHTPTCPVQTVENSTNDNVHHDNFPKFSEMPFSKIVAILTSLGLATFIFALEATIVATSVSSIAEVLDARGSLAWVSTGYLMTQTGLQPIVGPVADIVGAKRLLIIQVWIFIAGSLVSGLSNSMELLVAGRIISGVGASSILSLAFIILTYLTNETQRGYYFNLINAVFIVSDSMGPIVGATFAKSGNWRFTFFLLRYLHLPASPVYKGFVQTLKQTDIFGMTFLVSFLSFIIIFLNLGGQVYPWAHPTLIGLFIATGVSFAGFIVAEYYASLPVAPLRLFHQWEWRNIPIMLISRTLMFFHCFAMIFYIPIYLQVIGIESQLASAMVIPFSITAALSSILHSHFINVWPNRIKLIYHLPLLLLPVGLGLLSTLNETSSLGRVAGYSILIGFAFGSGTQISMIIGQNHIPIDILPTVTALQSTAPSLGGVLGIAIVGTVISSNIFKAKLLSPSSPFVALTQHLDDMDLNLNDAVSLLHLFPNGLDEVNNRIIRQTIIEAYVIAFQRGMLVLVGAGVFQILVSIPLRKVVLSNGKTEKP